MNPEPPAYLSEAEYQEWQRRLGEANRNNVFCHCRECGREWVTSAKTTCSCGSQNIEYILCWQFPDG